MKPTEEKVLNYIKKYHEEHSLIPTVREIRDGVGLKSTGSVHYILTRLREQGLITESNNKSRSCKIVNGNTLSFKAKWDKLKEFINNRYTDLKDLVENNMASEYAEGKYSLMRDICERIQRLENGE